jgi:SAM-dependent methyltransferase
MIGYNKSVLEVGCATGFFTKVLVERGCNVVGIEIDPEAAKSAEKWADRVIVGNLDDGEIWDLLENETFDVIVLGDVLEHLRDPLASLRSAARKLKPSGFVVISVPNIAHGDVRIALLQGTFHYNDTGLLDRTHVHFFTLETARDLLKQAGLVGVDTERVVMPLFMSELGVKREDVSHKVLDEILADPEAESYQFVMKAVRDNGTRTLAELGARVGDLSDQVHFEVVRTALLRRDVHARPSDFVSLQQYVEALEGHVKGLEHNIELYEQELRAANNRYIAVLNTRSVRLTAPLRRMKQKLRPAKPAS